MVAAVVLASSAAATEFRAFDRADQIRGSEVIVTGRILAVRSQWSADRSAIVTEADVAIDEVWKGTVGDRLRVRTFGGRVGNVALEVEGAAQFTAGERVVLYLRHAGGVYEPFGMRFGKYRIDGSGPAAVAIGSSPPRTPGEQQFAAVSLPLARLRAEVAELVNREVQ